MEELWNHIQRDQQRRLVYLHYEFELVTNSYMHIANLAFERF